MTLPHGARVPDFHLPSTHGEVALSHLLGRPFVLSFFSMAFTPV
jgi:peroxiredoxin